MKQENKTNKSSNSFFIIQVVLLLLFIVFTKCAEYATNVPRSVYKPICKPAWKGKTIFIDFDTNYGIWNNAYASNLSEQIRDQLIEGIVEDGCFNIQDISTGTSYLYKVGVRIANPSITVSEDGAIRHISAAFQIKTYNNKNNLITAKTRNVTYDAPAFVVTVNNSQEVLLQNYAHNVSLEIRKTVYDSFK